MNDIINNGEEVLIFRGGEGYLNQDSIKYIRGTIISSYESDDLSYHGSSWYLQLYKVLGEDGKTYICTYGTYYKFVASYFIKTYSDYLKYLDYIIDNNNSKIQEIKEYNDLLLSIKTSFNDCKNHSVCRYSRTLKK